MSDARDERGSEDTMMASENYFDTDVSLEDYLADRTRTSGSALGYVQDRPEDYRRWLDGNLPDRPTPAKNLGSYVHAKLSGDDSARFAYYPSRAEALEEVKEEVIGPRGGKSMKATGRTRPQDDSEEGRRTTMLRKTDFAKKQAEDWERRHADSVWIYPEQQPIAQAMLRAARAHPKVAELLAPGYAPEVTGYYTCPITGEPCRIRPDWIRLEERIWVEVKTWVVKGDGRLDTSDPKLAQTWAKQGWARKDAMLHDGCAAITGDDWTGYWVIIETTDDNPRVSVKPSYREQVGSFYTLGRDGGGRDSGLTGYIDLIRLAQSMRESRDFRHRSVREDLPWQLPGWLLSTMELELGNNDGESMEVVSYG